MSGNAQLRKAKLILPAISAAIVVVLLVIVISLSGNSNRHGALSLRSNLWPSSRRGDICDTSRSILAGRNWTDGDPTFPVAGVCKWHQKVNESRGPALASHLGIPKVAMLFLSMGKLRHEALWAIWFQSAAGQLPADCAASAKCSSGSSQDLGGLVGDFLGSETDHIGMQSLFSVYTHLPPTAGLLEPDSVFRGTEIPNRINSSWGTFDLAQVARNLMATALEDPLNMRFMTISESCIPIYPPRTVYHQLMYSPKSRINACTTRNGWGRDEYRWTWRLTEATGGRLQKEMWRKNHQWLSLTRKHARLTVADVDVAQAFAKHCYSGKDPDFGGWWRSCFSDEHYFSTLLAYHGLDEETDCMGELTHTLWCPHCEGDDRLHPKTYQGAETNKQLLRELRQEENQCDASKANKAAAAIVPHVLDARTWDSASWGQEGYILPAHCPLFARKFSDDSTAAAMHAVLGLMVLEETQRVRRRTSIVGQAPGTVYNSTPPPPAAIARDVVRDAIIELQRKAADGGTDEASVGGAEGSTEESNKAAKRAADRKRRRKQINRKQKVKSTSIQSLI